MRSAPALDYEAGLGLKMQLHPTDSPSCDGTGGGGPIFSKQPPYLPDGMLVQRSFHTSGGWPVSVFTATQWQELERQKVIHSYILASIPVPPQLLFPLSKSSPQSNTSGLDLRFSGSGIDPEPWRCRRTDGKKWRCSRDVAGEQKYCERHAHKNKPRSRKLVEAASSHSTKSVTTTIVSSTPASYDQTRVGRNSSPSPIPWFMGASDGMTSSSRMDLNRGYSDRNNNTPMYHPHLEDEQYFTITSKERHLFGSPSKDFPVLPSPAPPYGGNEKGIGKMNSDRESDGTLTPVSWMQSSSAPGGPLAEVLRLGNARTTGGGLDLASLPQH